MRRSITLYGVYDKLFEVAFARCRSLMATLSCCSSFADAKAILDLGVPNTKSEWNHSGEPTGANQ